ncbi:MAG: hypothetical protein ACRD1L_05260 [Terriglobales bacterium]
MPRMLWGVVLGLAAGLVAQTPPQKAAQGAKQPPGAFVVGASQTADPMGAKAAPPAAVTPAKRLPDPSPAEIQHIIQTFTTKEKLFRDLLKNDYTYTESIQMQELDDNGNPVGNFQQTNDVNYASDGAREIVCTFCPQPSLKDIEVTEEDLTDMFNMNMYTLSVDELPQYNIAYLDHEPLDQIGAYVFSVAPKVIVKGNRYFQGKVYVDDQQLMIVKGDGKVVPDEFDKHGNPTNTFLPFQVWRQEVDHKYWFPVYTLMQGSIPGGPGVPPTPMRMVIQFKNYKQFRATTRILSVQALPQGTTPPAPTAPGSDKKKPPPPTIPH